MAQIDINRRPQPPRIPRNVVTEDDTPHRTLPRPALPHQQHLLLLLLPNLRRRARARIRHRLRRVRHIVVCVEVEDNVSIPRSQKLGLAPRLPIDNQRDPESSSRVSQWSQLRYSGLCALVILNSSWEKSSEPALPALYPQIIPSQLRLPER